MIKFVSGIFSYYRKRKPAKMGKEKKQLSIFTDFDGTITHKDIGDVLFQEFGEFEPWHSMLRNGELKIDEYWRIVCSKLRPDATKENIEKFTDSIEVDPYFGAFADFCRQNDFELTILSDGYDVYINRVLERAGATDTRVFCNKMIFREGLPPQPYFPGASESCDCTCASCKRNSMLSYTSPDVIYVLIGDGFSDFCAAEHADIIFAKKDLAAYCNEKRLPHYPYHTFFDVRRILENAVKKNKIRTRHQAALKRKKAFEIE